MSLTVRFRPIMFRIIFYNNKTSIVSIHEGLGEVNRIKTTSGSELRKRDY